LYEEYGGLLSKENYFAYGTANETVGYLTNGTSDDWMYGVQSSKPKIIALTPESGGPDDGFWPVPSRVLEICKDNVGMNLMAAYLAGKYAVAENESNVYLNQHLGYFNYSIEELGLDTPATFTVTIQPLTSNIISVGLPKTYNNLSLLEKRDDSISFTLDPTIQNGEKIQYLLSIDNGLYAHADTITKYYGPSYIVFSENGNTMNNWYSGTGWGVTQEYFYSSPSSITDSPYSNYPDNTYSTIETTVPIDLTNAISAVLTFRTRWNIEPGADYVQLNISTDNGSTWTAACGKYTKPGNAYQAAGEPIYDGHQGQWVLEEVNLDSYIGQNISLQFELNSDSYANFDGFYFDDFSVSIIDMSNVGMNESGKLAVYLSDPIPNPASGNVQIRYSIPGNLPAELDLLDSRGIMIQKFVINDASGIVRFSVENYPSGIYFYRLKGSFGTSEVKKVIIIR